MRVLHSADWQLGRGFGRFEPGVRAALIEARFDAIDAIGQTARTHDGSHVLVAGDVFDTEGPEVWIGVESGSSVDFRQAIVSALKLYMARVQIGADWASCLTHTFQKITGSCLAYSGVPLSTPIHSPQLGR